MLCTDQAVQINRPQLDLITLRLAQPRPARRPLRTWLLRQILEKPIARHRYRPQWPLRKGIPASSRQQTKLDNAPKASQALRSLRSTLLDGRGRPAKPGNDRGRKSVRNGKRATGRI